MNTRLKIIIALIAISLSGRAYTQVDTIVWQNKSTLPFTPIMDYGSFVIDSDYYIIGGIDSAINTYSEVWKYDIPTNSWQQMKNFPGGPISEPAGFSINGKGYICCGIDSVSGYTKDNEFWEYYPVADTWQHKPNYPGMPRETNDRFVYNQYAFVGMGWGIGANDLWRYNAISDSWDSVSNIPSGVRLNCGISVIDSFANILGGDNSTSQLNDIWRYNMNQDHWDSIGIMPGGLRDGALYWTFDSAILIGYGFIEDSGNFIMAQDLYSYFPRINKWDTITCINFVDSTADDGSGCFQLGNTAYFFGGFKTDYPLTTYYNNVRSFDASKFLPDTTTGIVQVKNQTTFSVYPNPVSHENGFSISTSESGSILFYDALGRTLDERILVHGSNQIKLSTDDEVIFYRATLQSGAIENGKIVLYP